MRLPEWQVLLALMLTIPAFYIELLVSLPTSLAVCLYLVAALVLGRHTWHAADRAFGTFLRYHKLDAVLTLGLLLAALMPSSLVSSAALSIRLAVSMLALARMTMALKHWLARGQLAYLLLVAALLVVACGMGFVALEPTVTTLNQGMWLAFTTAATVGYGDVVPTSTAARIFSVFVVLLGYAVLSLVTAAIAAMWVQQSERQLEQDILRDMHAELKSLRQELAELRVQAPPASVTPDSTPPSREI